jgi:hypothetical protein
MIVYKEWEERTNFGMTVYRWSGWFLFGRIPLILKRRTVRID